VGGSAEIPDEIGGWSGTPHAARTVGRGENR